MPDGLSEIALEEDRPTLLDLFCGAGGATKGYQRAGFYVIGVDIKPQPRYCGDEFVQADALDILELFIVAGRWPRVEAIHASPPCQAYTRAGALRVKKINHPDLIGPTREYVGNWLFGHLESELPAHHALCPLPCVLPLGHAGEHSEVAA